MSAGSWSLWCQGKQAKTEEIVSKERCDTMEA